MLRITRRTGPRCVTLQVEGQIVADWVDEIERQCAQLLGADCGVALDLSSVTMIDQCGQRALNRLAHNGLRLVNGSPLLLELLKGD